MVDPAFHRSVEFGEGDFSGAIIRPVGAQSPGEFDDVARFDAAVGEYLADQLLLPMALAGGGSFTTLPPSRHTTTNIEIIKKFLEIEITAEQMAHRVWKIEVAK